LNRTSTSSRRSSVTDVGTLPRELTALQTVEAVLTLGSGQEPTRELLATIEGYNRDDCVSALRLRDWLEDRRGEIETIKGECLPWPLAKPGEPSEELAGQLARTRAVEAQLLTDLPADRGPLGSNLNIQFFDCLLDLLLKRPINLQALLESRDRRIDGRIFENAGKFATSCGHSARRQKSAWRCRVSPSPLRFEERSARRPAVRKYRR
jgi:hypothetical protein